MPWSGALERLRSAARDDAPGEDAQLMDELAGLRARSLGAQTSRSHLELVWRVRMAGVRLKSPGCPAEVQPAEHVTYAWLR